MNVSYIYQCPSTYRCHDSHTKTLILPFVNESEWSGGLRIALYLIALLWCFLGVAIAVDMFMCAIEEITSQTKIIEVSSEGDDPKTKSCDKVEVRVWNDTVANLTLMALGNSAPEILLAVIEIVGHNFESEELGPATILGSASFSLLCITAVSIIAVPSGKSKRIKTFPVFAITAFFAVFAYIWMFIVIEVASPYVISLAEAIITLLLFPTLVLLAYIADRSFCGIFDEKKSSMELELDKFDVRNEDSMKKYHPDLAEYMKEVSSNRFLSEEEAAKLISMRIESMKKKDYGHYRVGALRCVGGGRKIDRKPVTKVQAIFNGSVERRQSFADLQQLGNKSVVEFSCPTVSVVESAKLVQLGVRRSHNTSSTVSVNYETIDGTAEAGSDYIAKSGVLTFEQSAIHKYIDIIIIDDNEWEPDETFFVKLWAPKNNQMVEIGSNSVAQVTIINDDDPGVFQFTKPRYIIKENCSIAQVEVQRVNGSDGRIEVPYKMERNSTVKGKISKGDSGVLAFDHGETLQTIEVNISDQSLTEKDESFHIELGDISVPGAKLGKFKRACITVVNDNEYKKRFDRVVNLAQLNQKKFNLGTESWGEQFVAAMSVNGGNIDDATIMDYIMHALTFPWKVLFAFVPPCSWFHGWLAFFILILLIGLVTTVIGDLANVFGCLVGLKTEITAITFVALGTSVPDLLASRNAAINEKSADAAIGHITGGNGVNVFLGLGIPWTIASIYHQVKGSTFKAAGAGTLATSVVAYTVTAIICISLLVARRYIGALGKGELGGPSCAKYSSGTFLFILWLMYVLVSALVSHGHISYISFSL